MFQVKDLAFKQLFKGFAFEVEKGQIALFIGPSGVGKSTLFRLLNFLDPYESGQLLLNGHPLAQQDIGLVFQHFNLFDHLTVETNMTLALTLLKGKTGAEALEISHALLNRFGLAEKAKNYPKQLSGGQKQRLAIARTLALEPQIICFDEPTSALDPRLTEQVAGMIQDLADEQKIVLLATHDQHLVKLLNGKLFSMGL